MISVGFLYDAQSLLTKVSTEELTPDLLLKSFNKLEVAAFPAVLSMAQQCGWLAVNDKNILVITAYGKAVLNGATPALQLRVQIRDLVRVISPSWAKKIADGRKEAMSIMPLDARQLFSEAGLLDTWDDELVAWWDDIGQAARTKKAIKRLETGRKAEKLSLEYEKGRTGKEPEWTFAETNYAGYDLLSIVAKDNAARCAIEVKGSTLHLNEAVFTLTRNEWEAAQTSPNYRVHLWIVKSGTPDPSKDLRVLFPTDIEPHVPSNRGEGEWETTRIPFKHFWN